MNFLTKNTKSIIQQLDKIPEPRDFFNGTTLAWDGIPQKVLLFSRRKDFSAHRRALHSRFVMILNLDGAGGVVVDEKLFQLQPGHGLLIFPFQGHYYVRFHKNQIAWLFITFELTGWSTLEKMRNAIFRLTEESLGYAQQMVNIFPESLTKDNDAFGHLNLWLSLFLWHSQSQIQTRKKTEKNVHRHQPLIERMVHHISKNLQNSLSVDEIARATATSISHLQAVCHQMLGFGPGEYLRRARIRKACELLRSSSMNIGQISDECGFSSLYAFSRTFKQVMHDSPMAYRKSNQY